MDRRPNEDRSFAAAPEGERQSANPLREAWRKVKRARIMAQERAGDRRLGIDTCVDSFNIKLDPKARNNPYEPTNYSGLDELWDRLRLGPDDVFYDIGCGKARVTCYMATKPIKRAVGVEYDADLVKTAEANARTLKGRKAKLDVILADATSVDYSDATLIFMFNPFGEEVVRKVAQRLPTDRRLRVCYMGPAHASVFSEDGAFVEEQRFSVPYDLGRAQAIVWTREPKH